MIQSPHQHLVLVDGALWVLACPIGLSVYDFDFEAFLPCSHPWERPQQVTAVSRIGAFEDYAQEYNSLKEKEICLLHTPAQHLLCSELPNWYSLLADHTPRSVWYDQPPIATEVAKEFRWPLFVKGVRQTSRHQKGLSIIDGPEAFDRAMDVYRQDPILKWQQVVCREYINLRPVGEPKGDKIPSSFEFRTFWWRGELVGCGRYWWEEAPYHMTESERTAALGVATEVARRIQVPFLVVDVAQTVQGKWIVIECNDGQESGYAGVSPIGMWQTILDIEKRMRWGT